MPFTNNRFILYSNHLVPSMGYVSHRRQSLFGPKAVLVRSTAEVELRHCILRNKS